MAKRVFEPVNIGSLRLKNRLVRSATWEAVAEADGGITPAGYQICEEVTKGGIGLFITGFTSVDDNDCYFDGMMRLSRDDLVPQYAELANICHAESCPILAQLALGAFYRKGPSGFAEQVEIDDMTIDEVQRVERMFIEAAVRASKAGFDGVQIHAAHFFFLSRFISPAVNHRTDEYGGSLENRLRIVTQILNGIKRERPDFHVSVKINSTDRLIGGLTESTSLEACKILANTGIDSIEVSGNGTSVQGVLPHKGEAYFEPMAARLASLVDVPVILVGGLRSRDTMESILAKTDIELLSLSRPLLFDPLFPRKLENGQVDESGCRSCNACYSTFEHRCIFRKELQ